MRASIIDMVAAAPLLAHDDRRQEDHFVHLRGASWEDYQRVVRLRGDHSAPRINFLEGILEIMSPSRGHESVKSNAGRLVEVWCQEHTIDFSTYGSWTLEDEAVERAAEPDECYVFSETEDPKRPDLAIEVVWTSGGLNKLDIYRKLGVREVWYWRRGRFSVHALRDEQYQEISASEVLPGIDLVKLADFLHLPTSRAIRQYRASLQAR